MDSFSINDNFTFGWETFNKYKSIKWLFPGARKEKHISMRTVQAIFEQAMMITRINGLSYARKPMHRILGAEDLNG